MLNEPLWSVYNGYIKLDEFQKIQDGNLVGVFFLIKGQMANAMLNGSMSPDIWAFKVQAFTNVQGSK